MFRIKICGVRQVEDVQAVAESGADAVGLNFFPPSVRYLNPKATATRDLSQVAKKLGLSEGGRVRQ